MLYRKPPLRAFGENEKEKQKGGWTAVKLAQLVRQIVWMFLRKKIFRKSLRNSARNAVKRYQAIWDAPAVSVLTLAAVRGGSSIRILQTQTPLPFTRSDAGTVGSSFKPMATKKESIAAEPATYNTVFQNERNLENATIYEMGDSPGLRSETRFL